MTVRAAAATRRTTVNGSRKGGGVARLFPSGGGPIRPAWSLRPAGVSPALNRSLRPACCSQPRCTHRKPPDYKLPGSFASTLRVPCLVSDNRLRTVYSKLPASRTQRGPSAQIGPLPGRVYRHVAPGTLNLTAPLVDPIPISRLKMGATASAPRRKPYVMSSRYGSCTAVPEKTGVRQYNCRTNATIDLSLVAEYFRLEALACPAVAPGSSATHFFNLLPSRWCPKCPLRRCSRIATLALGRRRAILATSTGGSWSRWPPKEAWGKSSGLAQPEVRPIDPGHTR